MINHSAGPLYIDRNDLSLAWGEVFVKLLAPGVSEICPLSLSISGFSNDGSPRETLSVRNKLENLLIAKGVSIDIETVAFTIFPDEYWQLADKKLADFFSLYRESFTRIQDWNARNNKRGSYFQRLVDYEGNDEGHNQLEWILKEFKRNPSQRISQFQATTYNPLRDQTKSAQLEFPCLQQVSFVPMKDGTLSMNAFYATQQIFRKGYGNYLGLCRLGNFVAVEMGLKLNRVNIFVGVAKMDEIGKTDPQAKELVDHLKELLLEADKVNQAA